MPLKEIAKELILLIGIAVIAAFTANFFSPNGINPFDVCTPPECTETPKFTGDVGINGFEAVSVLRAKEIFDSGEAVFVDARALEFYLNGHISDAVSLPLARFNRMIKAFKMKHPGLTHIVTYCYDESCNDGRELARNLFDAGYMNVGVLVEGYLGWEREGFPVE